MDGPISTRLSVRYGTGHHNRAPQGLCPVRLGMMTPSTTSCTVQTYSHHPVAGSAGIDLGSSPQIRDGVRQIRSRLSPPRRGIMMA
jgi:hypothetical protein